ncbi:DUF4214 domain-containing protein [Chelatococcus sp. GCM10030263]
MQVIDFYESLLLRTPSESEVDYWIGRYQSGNPLDHIRADFLNSDEYHKLHDLTLPLVALYQAAFGRAPDAEGLTYWSARYRSGEISFDELVKTFVRSDEFHIQHPDSGPDLPPQELVKLFYQNLLGREPDAGGLQYWTEQLAAGKLAGDQIAKAFLTSEEFKTVGEANLRDIVQDAADGILDQPHAPLVAPIATLENGTLHFTMAGAYHFQIDGPQLVVTLDNRHSTFNLIDLLGVHTVHLDAGAAIEVDAQLLGAGLPLHAVTGQGTINLTGVTFTEASASGRASTNVDLAGIAIGEGVHLEVNGTEGDAIIAKWGALDHLYTFLAGLPNGNLALFNNDTANGHGYSDSTHLGQAILGEDTLGAAAKAVNIAFIKLAAEYAHYLEDGGAPLTEFTAKFGTGRDQSLHDNLLANGGDAGIDIRKFDPDTAAQLRDLMPDWVENRPVYSGIASDVQAHRAVLAYDWDHGIARPDYVSLTHGATVDPSGTSGGEMLFGDGNMPDHYDVARHDGLGIELDLKVHYRTSAEVVPGVTDENGVTRYTVDAGHQQDGVHGMHGDNLGRAAWNFDFAALTGLNGRSETLDDYHFQLKIDVDPTQGTDYLTFDLGGAAGSTPWLLGTDPLIADEDGLNPHVSQNSVNFGFDFLKDAIDTDPHMAGIQPYGYGGGDFDIVLTAYDQSGVQLLANHIQVHVNDPV